MLEGSIWFTFFDTGVGMEMSNCEAKIIIERMILWEISLDFIIIGQPLMRVIVVP